MCFVLLVNVNALQELHFNASHNAAQLDGVKAARPVAIATSPLSAMVCTAGYDANVALWMSCLDIFFLHAFFVPRQKKRKKRISIRPWQAKGLKRVRARCRNVMFKFI